MARSTKQISHDLLPLSKAVSELSDSIAELLEAIEPYAQFNEDKAAQYFSECSQASQDLAYSARLIRDYVLEVDAESESEGITKDT